MQVHGRVPKVRCRLASKSQSQVANNTHPGGHYVAAGTVSRKVTLDDEFALVPIIRAGSIA